MCIFCKIINGEIPCYKVYEDDKFLAFLDISQATVGHTLVVPKKHYPNILSLEDNDILGVVSLVCNKIEKALDVHNFNILNNCGVKAGQTVDHFHIHIIPRYDNDTMKIEFGSNELTKEAFGELCDKIKKN